MFSMSGNQANYIIFSLWFGVVFCVGGNWQTNIFIMESLLYPISIFLYQRSAAPTAQRHQRKRVIQLADYY